jgi:TolB-like protein
MSLWNELRRRNVFKVGAAYLVIAWLLAQVASIVAPALRLPDWTTSFVVFILMLGLPIALVLAWAYELTPEGIRRTESVPPEASITHVTGRRLNFVVTVLLGLAVVFLLVDSRRTAEPVAATDAAAESSQTTDAAPVAPSSRARIAILPFDNLSPDPNNAFFADGLHEEVLSTLAARAPGLEVVSWMTMRLYRGAPKPVREIAAELDASYVLGGSVTRDGDMVRLRLQLVDARTDSQLWTQDYTRTLTNALSLQSEVASRVAEQLSLRFVGADQSATPITADPVAYDLYLRAKLARRNLNGAMRAEAWLDVENQLTRALERDPAFLQAYFERLDVRLQLFWDGYVVDESIVERARSDLETMRRLAPTSPLTLVGDARLALAEPDFARALEFMDAAQAAGYSDVELLMLRAQALGASGRFDEVDAVAEQIVAVDPGNPAALAILFFYMSWMDQPEEAMRLLAIGAAHQPQSPMWPTLRAQTIYDFTGSAEPLLRFINPAAVAEASEFDIDDTLRVTFDRLAMQGRYRDARDMLDRVGRDTIRAPVYWYYTGYGTSPMPTAELRGWASLLLDDRDAAAQDGTKLLAFVAAAPTTRWNGWFLTALTAEGELFLGRRVRAIAAAGELLSAAEMIRAAPQAALARAMAARVFAWAGEHDTAVDLLERLAVTPPIMAPTEIARSPYFNVPLGDDPRFEALSARLEAKMASTRLD